MQKRYTLPAIATGMRVLVLAATIAAVWTPRLASAQSTGAISGTVTDAPTSAPIERATVYVWRLVGTTPTYVAGGNTDATGFYTVTGLAPGTYYASTATLYTLTESARAHINEYYDNLPCAGACSANVLTTTGTPILVSAGATTSGKNFALERGSLITGTVTNTAGTPLEGINVYFYAPSGAYAAMGTTNAAGYFATNDGLPAGTYYSLTTNSSNYIDEIFDNIPCSGRCTSSAAIATGTPIVVATATNANGKNYVLERGGSISGRVTNQATGAALANTSVAVYLRTTTSYVSAGSATTDAAGVYTVAGLNTGTYYAYTSTTLYVDEIYDNVQCPLTCVLSTTETRGTGIAVVAGAATTGKDFALAPGGTITGVVKSAATGAPVQGATVWVTENGTLLQGATTNASGVYTLTGVGAGTFHAHTANSAGLINQIYGGIPCYVDCLPAATLLSAPIVVTGEATTAGIDFALNVGGSITGTVTNEATGAPLQGVNVTVFIGAFDSHVPDVGLVTTNAAGQYTVSGLPSGNYYLWTSNAQGYINEIYNNVQCAGQCSVRPFAEIPPIGVSAGVVTPGKDFALAPGGGISGTVTDAATSLPLPAARVFVYSRDGNTYAAAGTVLTDSAGRYTLRGLPGGTYYALSSNTAGYKSKIYDGLTCEGPCAPLSVVTSGTPITVSTGVITTGRNFSVSPSTAVPNAPLGLIGTVTNATARLSWSPSPEGSRPASYLVEAGLSSGTTAFTFPATTTSFTTPAVPPGQYFFRVRAVNATGSSAASEEYVLVMGSGGVAVPGRPGTLSGHMIGNRLVLTWNAPGSGGEAASYIVEAGTGLGAANIASVVVTTRAFTYDPVPNGLYYFRVRARNAAGVSEPSNEMWFVVGDGPTPPGGVGGVGAVVNGSRVTLSWGTAVFNPIGYMVEAGSGPGLSDVAIYNAGNVTTVTFADVPAGTYYVRVRAVNGQGSGLRSADLQVVVR